MSEPQPDILLIVNLVDRRPDGRVLFVRYRPDDESWWLPGEARAVRAPRCSVPAPCSTASRRSPPSR